MPLTGTANPEQLRVLTAALEKRCLDYGIEDGEEYESLARLLMTFYHSGARSIEELTAALATTSVQTPPIAVTAPKTPIPATCTPWRYKPLRTASSHRARAKGRWVSRAYSSSSSVRLR